MPVNGDRRFFPGQGCGCCSHCRCTGRCVVNGDESDENNQIAIISASPAPIPRRPTPAPPPLDDNESLLNESTQSKSIWTTLESLPHPNDMISSKNSNRSAFNSPTPLTPFVNQAMQQSRLREIPPIPNNNIVKPIAKETTTTTTTTSKEERHKRDLNGNTSSDQNSFPGSKPLNRLASRKGLPEGGLSIEVPKQKKPSDNHSPERKHVKAKSRNMSRKTAKVDESEEEEEKVEFLRKEKSKRHNSITTDDEEDSRHGSKNNHSKTHKNGSHRKSSKHHDHSAEEEHENEHEEDKKERKKTISHKPKLCRKHSKSGTSHLQLSKSENMGEIEVRTWAPTPQMGTFDSPKYERFNHDDEDQQNNQDDSILQQMQHQRDREWQREQDREREHFNGRDHHEDSSNHNHKSNGKSAKTRSASRKHDKHVDRKQHSEDSDFSEEEKEIKKSSKKDRQRDQERSHKPDRKKSMRVRKKHSESEDESSEPEKKRSSSRSKHKKSSSKKKRTVHEDESEEEESHEKDESEDDHEEEEEESSLSETEKKKKKSSKKKINTKHQNNSPSSAKEKEEDQCKSKEKSSGDDLEENNSNKLILTRNESQLGDFESRSNSGNLVPQPQELKHTISIGNFSITRTRMVKNANSSASLRSLSRPEQEKEGSNDDNNNNNNNNKENTIDIARDRIKTFLDSKMKDSKTISPKPSFSKLGMTPRSSPLNASHSDSLFVQPPPLRSTPSLSTLNAVNKLIVQHSSTQMNTLYFIDMGHIDQDGNPMVAFRIEADPNIEMNENLNNKKSKKNNNIDWLISSHESGTKLKGRLFVSAGKEGQLLYVIDIKKRHVDKFVIQSSPQHIKNFSDSPHWGNHEDYKHLYCHSPENKQLKWFIQEPGKLMRLFGRSETDHGHIYAEARLATVPPNKKTKKVTKEATLFFYEHPSQQSAKLKQQQQQNSNEKEPTGLQMDIGYLCATWWCARQTYDEGQIAAAHAEVEMIENIEKAFEVDLLAGA